MRKIISIQVSLLAILILFNCINSVHAQTFSLNQSLDSLFKNRIAEKEMAGAVCLISHKGNIIYNKSFGYRNIEKKLPMQTGTYFRMRSMLKPIITVAILKLVQEGRINLDDPATKYFPELNDKKVGVKKDSAIEYVAAIRPITLRQLLSHSSGLGTFWNAGVIKSIYLKYDSTAFPSFKESIEAYMRLPLIDQPGNSWHYGSGHLIMAYLIEKVTGISYKEYFKNEIFRPLKMNHTTFQLPKGKDDELAQYYSLTKGQLKKTLKDSAYTGGDDLMSTAEDYYKFCTLLMNNGKLNGKAFIRSNLMKEFITPVVGLNAEEIPWHKGYAFALGVSVRINEDKADFKGSLGDFGWIGLFNTAFWIDPKKQLTGIVLSQTYHNMYQLSKAVKNVVYTFF